MGENRHSPGQGSRCFWSVEDSGLQQASAVMAFSVRTGGVSPSPFDSLNFSVSHGDCPDNVQANTRILAEQVGIDPHAIVTPRQVHSDRIVAVNRVPREPVEADALVTRTPGLWLGIKTADCVPVLMCDVANGTAAAVHAGWRGSALRIVTRMVQFLTSEYGTLPANIVAAIGPSIRGCCYEVGEPVSARFQAVTAAGEPFVMSVNDAKSGRTGYRLDLAEFNRWELLEQGVRPENIYCNGMCTCCRPDLFFSYRRDGEMSGRHLSVVGFRGL